MKFLRNYGELFFLWLFGLLLFGVAGSYQFVTLDDGVHVFKNAYLHTPNSESLNRFWRSPFQGLYIPVTYTVWWAQAKLTQWLFPEARSISPLIFHWTNVVLHTANGVLVYVLIRTLSLPRLGALFGALLFLVHPMQVEAVAWVSSLKDTLSAFFLLLSGIIYLVACGEWSRKRGFQYGIASLFFVVGLLSKPVGVVWPLVLIGLAVGFQKTSLKRGLLEMAPWLLVSVVVAWLTKSSQPDAVIEPLVSAPKRILVALDSVAFYASKLVWPSKLSLNYGRNPETVVNGSVFLPILGATFLATLAWCLRGQRRWSAIGAVIFLPLLPVLGLIPFYYQKYSTVADRYFYLSMLGVALAVALVSEKFSSRAGRMGIVTILLVLTQLTRIQLTHWENNLELVHQMTKVDPNADNHYSLAYLLSQQDGPKLPSEQKTLIENAVAFHYLEAIRLNPKHAEAYNNLGLLRASQGKSDLALGYFGKALEINPLMTTAYNNRGVLLAQLRRFPEAISSFEEAMSLEPGFVDARFNLGFACELSSQVPRAIAQYEAVLKMNPKHAMAQERLGRLTKR